MNKKPLVEVVVRYLRENYDGMELRLMERVAVPETSLEGLKEIGNLASWTVSTAKPGNGIEQLRDEDTNLFWQQVLHVLRFPLRTAVN